MKHKALSLVVLSLHCGLMANPTNPEVMNGDVSFDSSAPGVLSIQAGDRSIINWQDFSIHIGEMTQFIQPDVSSAVLNRVMGGNASSIMGSLQANGKVYLINPNGVIFGKDAIVDTGALVASTLDLPDQLFMQNGDLLFSSDSEGVLVNFGAIKASNGDVILIGYQVENNGTIDAPNGVAALGAGQEILIRPLAQERVYIRLSAPQEDRSGTGVHNEGRITALQAELRADGNPFAKAINHAGTVEATGIEAQGGKVFLVSEKGTIEVSGIITALDGAGNGGEVDIMGENIGISSTAQVNVDAACDGNGGTALLFGDNAIQFFGSINAEAGTFSGNGGFVEISAPNLIFEGEVTTLAPAGETGMLVLDPNDITISMNAMMGTIGIYPVVYDGAGYPTANLNNTALASALLSSNVTIMTDDETNGGVGDITFMDPVVWNSPYGLTVLALNDITILTTVYNEWDTSMMKPPSRMIVMNAQNDLNIGNGAITTPSQLGSNNGDIMLSVGNNLNLIPGTAAGAFAQIGGGSGTITSSIYIDLVGNNVHVEGGIVGATNAYASIGHGGPGFTGGVKTGDITINTIRGSLTVGSARQGSYAQIGHYSASSNMIPATAGGDISLPGIGIDNMASPTFGVNIIGGAAANAFALIGHGGDKIITGDLFTGGITVFTEGPMNIKGGTAASTFAGIGFSNGFSPDMGVVDVNGSGIDVLTNQDLQLVAGSADFSIAFIGAFFGNIPPMIAGEILPGDIRVTAERTIQILGNPVKSNTFAAIGTNSPTTTPSGSNVTVYAGDLLPGERSSTPSLFIAGGGVSAGITNGNNTSFTELFSFDLNVIAVRGAALNKDIRLAPTGFAFINSRGTADIYVRNNDLVLNSSDNALAQITTADVTDVFAGNDVILQSCTVCTVSPLNESNITCSGGLTVEAGHDLIIEPFSFIQGNLTVSAGNDLIVNGANPASSPPLPIMSTGSTLEILAGHDIFINGASLIEPTPFFFLTMTVSAGNDLNVGLKPDGVTPSDFASQLGIQKKGEMFISAGNDVNVLGGTAIGAFAQIGSDDSATSIINTTFTYVGNNVNVIGGSASNTSAQIGTNSTGPVEGDITFTFVGNSINVTGGLGDFANPSFALIGSKSSATANPAIDNNLTFTFVGQNVTLQPSTSFVVPGSFAQIGALANGTVGSSVFSSILFTDVNGSVKVNGGAGLGNYGLIGTNGSGEVEGSITFNNVAGDVSVISGITGSPDNQSYAQIGTHTFGLILFGDINFRNVDGSIFVESNSAFAQIGHRTPIGGGSIFGDIFIGTVGVDISVTALADFAQIGSFSDATGVTVGSSITIEEVGRDINVFADEAKGMIGSVATAGTASGDIAVGTVGRDVNVTGITTEGIAQIGIQSFATTFSNISFLTIGRDLNVIAGAGDNSYALLGPLTTGVLSNITGLMFFGQELRSTELGFIGGNVNVLGGGGVGLLANTSFAQIGPYATGNVLGGMIFNDVLGSVNVTGGKGDTGSDATAAIGPFGVNIGDNSDPMLPNPYDILFTSVAENVNVTGGLGMNAFALIGQQANQLAPGGIVGSITFTSVLMDVNVEGAGGAFLSTQSFAQIGQKGSANVTGDIVFTTVGRDVNVMAGEGDSAFAIIGQTTTGPETPTDKINGFITFGTIGRDVNVLGGPGTGHAFAQIGPNSGVFTIGAITFTTVGRDVNVRGGFGLNSPFLFPSAQIGPSGATVGQVALVAPPTLPNPYDITFTTVVGDVNVIGGSGFNSCALIGQTAFRPLFGNIHFGTVFAVNVEGNGGGSLSQGCFGQIGQMGVRTDSHVIGDLTFDTVLDDVRVLGGIGQEGFAHVGASSQHGDVIQNILFDDIGGDVIVTAGTTFGTYALIGPFAEEGTNGDITFHNVAGHMAITGGGDPGSHFCFGQIGPFSMGLTPDNDQGVFGDLFIDYIGTDLNLTGGEGTNGYAQLGPKVSGDVPVSYDLTIREVGQDIGMFAGNADNAYVQIGGMANNTGANPLNCVVTIVSIGNNLSLIANQKFAPPPVNAYAQIGNRAPGGSIGTVHIGPVGDTTKIIPGPQPSNYALLVNTFFPYIAP